MTLAEAEVDGKAQLQKTRKRQLEGLNCLRGLAALSVLLYHLHFSLWDIFGFREPFFREGYAGVDLFFVLSGFVIFYSNCSQIGSGRVRPYLAKRFFRIYPTYWLTILPFFIFGAWGPFRTSQPHGLGDLLSALGLCFGHTSYDGVSWTLSFEIYFYLIFVPLIISRKGVIAPLLIFAASFYINFVSLENPWLDPGRRYALNSLTLEFALGLLAAGLFSFRKRMWSLPYQALFGLGAVTYFGASFWSGERCVRFGLPAFLLVWSAAVLERNLQDQGKRLAVPRLLNQLGDASYMLYLIHLPLLRLGLKMIFLLHPPQGISCILSALVCLATCCLSLALHQRIERPLLALVRKSPRS